MKNSDNQNFEVNRQYWNEIASIYQSETRISTDDFHYGPLAPGDCELGLLPTDLNGIRCLELGCGGAQNSVYLAKHGATCVAMDCSEAQLDFARELSKRENVKIELVHADMAELTENFSGEFDLIHSSFALPFSNNPRKVLMESSSLLKEGGQIIFSMAHPLAAGEWLEVDNDEFGVFLNNYFESPPDIRYNDDGSEEIRSNFHPIGEICDWVASAGLLIERIVEPGAVDYPEEDELTESKPKAPYFSEDWLGLSERYKDFPILLVFVCKKPDTHMMGKKVI